MDDDARIVHLNRPALELAHLPSRALVGRTVDSLDGREPWTCVVELLRAGVSPRRTQRRFARDLEHGRTWDVEIRELDEISDERVRYVIATHDVTRSTELQDTLARGDGLAALGALTAGVAHEVRNPLFAITATLDAFAGDDGHAALVGALRPEVDRVAKLVRELLEYGRPEAPARVPTSITELAAEAIASTALLATARGVTVRRIGQGPAIAPVDRERMLLVCRNLVENAIQHAPPGSLVEVTITESTDSDGSWVDFVVVDRGAGFPAEALDKVFVPFFTRRTGGTGLGLALAQRIVHTHGGRIVATHRVGGGALVAMALPALG